MIMQGHNQLFSICRPIEGRPKTGCLGKGVGGVRAGGGGVRGRSLDLPAAEIKRAKCVFQSISGKINNQNSPLNWTILNLNCKIN